MGNDVLDAIYVYFITIVQMPEIQVLTAWIVVNFVAAVAAAIATNTFDPEKLWEVYGRKLLPIVMMYSVVRIAKSVVGAKEDLDVFAPFLLFINASPTAFLIAIAALLASDLLGSLSQIPGLDGVIELIPKSIGRFVLNLDTRFEIDKYLDDFLPRPVEGEDD